MKPEDHIFSIGHGNKTIDELISELKSFEIQFLVDIRSVPYSRINSQFNRERLKFILKEKGISYGYMGDVLGGLPKDSSCYTDGKVDYNKLKEKAFFRKGLERLRDANDQSLQVCLMCSEMNPKECHRTKLIGVELQKIKIELQHIIGVSKKKSQSQVIAELTHGNGLITLFGEEHFVSRKKYL